MRLLCDVETEARNFALHGVAAFDAVTSLRWTEALIGPVFSPEAPADSLIALAPIGETLCVLVFTVEERGLRLISLRRATRREIWQAVRFAIVAPTPAEDATIQAGIAADPSNPELDAAFQAAAIHAVKLMPLALRRAAKRSGIPIHPETLSFDHALLEHFRISRQR